jgi:8-oxo-dGDP phosphatase
VTSVPADVDAPGEPFGVASSTRPFTGRVVRLRVDQVRMPGGTLATREVVEHDLAVAIAAVDEHGRVVLIEQYRHPLRRRLWELPAGLMDVESEGPLSTARRELLEETGLAAGRWRTLVDACASPGFTDEAVRVFLAEDLTDVGRPPLGDDEEADLRVVRVPLNEAVDAALDGRIVNGASVSGVLAAWTVLVGGRAARAADDREFTGPATKRAAGESMSAPPFPGSSGPA